MSGAFAIAMLNGRLQVEVIDAAVPGGGARRATPVTLPGWMTPLATQPVVVAPPTEFDTGFCPRLVSEVTLPPGVKTSVCGVSSDTDQALPQGPA